MVEHRSVKMPKIIESDFVVFWVIKPFSRPISNSLEGFTHIVWVREQMIRGT